jgi:pimeloyl-ACP methyl ester carboxylesterase
VTVSPAELVLRQGEGTRTLDARRGRTAARVVGEPETIADILAGQLAGVEAFLEGRVTITGSLSLALELETLFGARHPARWTRAERVRAGSVDTFFLEAGEGEPVILVHGLGGTNASFLPTLWALSAHHRVLAPDLPGHGETAKPIRTYDPAFYARWLEYFMKATGVERAHVVGNSLGGRIALETAITRPQRVISLALLCPAPVVHRLRRLVPFVRLLRPELSFVPLPVARRQALFAVRGLFARPDRVPSEWLEAAAGEFVRVFRQPTARIAFFSSLREVYLEEPLGADGYWERLKRIKAPTLLLWGDRDPLVPTRHASAVRKAMPHATSIMLRGCGHVPQYEMASEVNRLLLAFIADPDAVRLSPVMNRLPQTHSSRAAGAARTA